MILHSDLLTVSGLFGCGVVPCLRHNACSWWLSEKNMAAAALPVATVAVLLYHGYGQALWWYVVILQRKLCSESFEHVGALKT